MKLLDMRGLRVTIFTSVVFFICSFDYTDQKREKTTINSAEHELTAYVFLAPDCPISLKYLHTLKEMDSIFRSKVEFIGLFPKTYSKNELEEFRREFNIDFDIVIDDNNTLIEEFNISVTPEVILVKAGKVFYQGAIDNWFYALGKNRAKPTEYYLRDAINLTLADKRVKVAKTEAIGCIISK
ncbi:MAG: hypothetical protein RIB63_08615 [Fulvivirga sp.]